MPVEQCQQDGQPGKRWGKHGKCYTYSPGDKDSEAAAQHKAAAQGAAAHASGFREGQEDWGRIEHLLEVSIPSDAMHVDREKAVISGVRILGPSSLNGRKYTPEAIQKAAALYENRPVNVDHPEDVNKPHQRSVRDRFGWLKNVHYHNDGLEGELHYLKTHPQTEQVLEAADRNPALFGLSHNADGRLVQHGKEYLVEEIVGVRSVDLVADPATTKSLFESYLQEQAMEDVVPPVEETSAAPDTFDILVGKLREIWDGQGDASGKAGTMNKVIRTLLKLEDALSNDKTADTPAETAPAAEAVEQQAVAAGMTAIQEALDKLVERMDSIQKLVETPPQRPRNVPLKESQGQYVPPKDSTETAKRLKRR